MSRTVTTGVVYEDLEEALAAEKKVIAKHRTLSLWQKKVKGETYYVWAVNSVNATSRISHHLGDKSTATKVNLSDIYAILKLKMPEALQAKEEETNSEAVDIRNF